MTGEDLAASGYPDPRGSLYFVAGLQPIGEVPTWLRAINFTTLQPDGLVPGAPYVRTWWS